MAREVAVRVRARRYFRDHQRCRPKRLRLALPVGVSLLLVLHYLLLAKYDFFGLRENDIERVALSSINLLNNFPVNVTLSQNRSLILSSSSISAPRINRSDPETVGRSGINRMEAVGVTDSQIVSRILTLPEFDEVKARSDSIELVTVAENTTCFRSGTAVGSETTTHATGNEFRVVNDTGVLTSRSKMCECRPDWYGEACSVPDIVWRSDTPWPKSRLSLRAAPRRVVMAFPFNIEFDLLEIRFAELQDIVDVFVILESNYTAHGSRKRLNLLDRIRNGTYERRIVDKIVYVLLDYFPANASKDGWIADALHRNRIGTHGLPRIRGLRSDDLFFLTDADEIPSRLVVNFLRWHDGYSEPVQLRYQWFVYGFFWQDRRPFQDIPSVVTMSMVYYVYRFRVYRIRSGQPFIQKNEFDVKVFMDMSSHLPENRRHVVHLWTLGSDSKDTAGWHCSWCLDPSGISFKLSSAQNGDFPRWGDFPEKLNTTYIMNLIRTGTWFDDKNKMTRVTSIAGPPHLLANREKYRHLIDNIYE